MAILFIFLVAGTDDGAPEVFADRAKARAKQWVTKFVDEVGKASALALAGDLVRFVLFKCRNNAAYVAELELKSKGTATKLRWTGLASFTASGDAAYDPSKFVVMPSGTTLLGMPHIYQSVRKAPEKSILELAVLSHAWVDGPVLQGSSPVNDDSPPPDDQTTGVPLPLRNAGDTQGRVRTDFSPNMGEDPAGVGNSALDEFKARFSPKGSFFIFGCDGQDGPRVPTNVPVDAKGNPTGPTFLAARPHLKSTAGEVIHQVYVKPLKDASRGSETAYTKMLRKGSVPDATTVTIDMAYEFKDEVRDVRAGGHYNVVDLTDLQTLHYGMDPQFFNVTGTKFTKRWDQVLGFIARQMQTVYGYQAAKALVPSGVTVLTGAPGTKSSEDGKDQMAVCGNFPATTDCNYIVNFYSTFIRLSTGPIGERKFFALDDAAVSHIDTLATVI